MEITASGAGSGTEEGDDRSVEADAGVGLEVAEMGVTTSDAGLAASLGDVSGSLGSSKAVSGV